MKFFIPLKRDINALPPAISLIRGLASLGHEVHLFSYYHSPQTAKVLEHPRIIVKQVSTKPYPTKFFSRVFATIRAHVVLWSMARSIAACDVLWVTSWDYAGLKLLSRMRRTGPKLIYQAHEFEPERFNLCRAADMVVVPEDNRAWITFVMAGLKTKPLVLPNMPYHHPRALKAPTSTIISQLAASGRRTVLYQGYCSIKGRCLIELFEAISLSDKRITLCIMPFPELSPETQREIHTSIKALNIEDRVHFIPSMEAPSHMSVIGQAHIGIGLYRPTSINQIYCAPNRLYEFTGFGIPVVLPSTPAIQQIAAHYPGILTCDPTKPASIAAALNLMTDDAAYERATAGAKAFFDNEGSYVMALESVLAQLG